jgi:hypothetical protein
VNHGDLAWSEMRPTERVSPNERTGEAYGPPMVATLSWGPEAQSRVAVPQTNRVTARLPLTEVQPRQPKDPRASIGRRSRLQTTQLVVCAIVTSVREGSIRSDFANLVSALGKKPRRSLAPQMREFRQECVDAQQGECQSFVSNSSRSRRTLTRSLLVVEPSFLPSRIPCVSPTCACPLC